MRLPGLTYLSNARLPSEKANAVQSLQQCEAFGHRMSVEFWHPRRSGTETSQDAVLRHYGIAQTFELRTLRCLDPGPLRRVWPRAGFWMQTASFQAACVARLLRGSGATVVYTRNALDLLAAPLLRRIPGVRGVFLEDHDGFGRRAPALKAGLLRALDGLVVTTELHAEAARRRGVDPRRILVAANAVDLRRFERVAAPSAGPPYRVIYVGNVFRRKGVYTLVEALGRLPSVYALEVAGGSPEALPALETFIRTGNLGGRVRLHGVIAPTAVPALLADAHVAVLPNSAHDQVSSTFTSPLKMFEYMAAGVPIVASDVPAVRQVLRHDVTAWLVPPDDPAALAQGIAHVCTQPDVGTRLARAARADVERRTWDARAEKIIGFMELQQRW